MKFELFYLDWSVGCFLTALLGAFTLGSISTDSNHYGGITFLDHDLSVAGEKYLYAFAGGLIFNFANLCLCKGIAMLGLALAFPLCIGTAMVLGTVLTYALDTSSYSNPVMLFIGLAIAFAAVVVAAVMHSIKDKEMAAKEPLTADVEGGETPKEDATMTRKLVICIGGGILMGCWNPLVVSAESDGGLTPYGEFVVYTLAVVLSSFVFIPMIIAFPMEGFKGQAVGSVLATWSKTPLICHIYALLGGFVWSVGTLTNATAGVSEDINGNPMMAGATSYAIGQCANVAAIFWGLTLWGEFTGTSGKVKGLVATVVGLYIVAVVFLTLAS